MNRFSVLAQFIGFLALTVGSVVGYEQGIFGTDIDPKRFAVALAIGCSIYLGAFRVMDVSLPGRPKPKLLDREVSRFDPKIAEMEESEQLGAIRRSSYINELGDFLGRSMAPQTNSARMEQIRLLLQRAGYHSRKSYVWYSLAKAVAPALGAVVGTAVALSMFDDLTSIASIIGTLALVASMSVDWYLKRVGKTRLNKIEMSFPDVMDLVMIGVQSGLSIDRVLDRVVSELRQRDEAIRSEIRVLLSDLNILPTRREAYDLFIERIPVQNLVAFATLLKQSEDYGTSITGTLKVLAEDTRRQRLYMAEKKAARIPVLSLIPMAVLVLPALFIIILTPAFINAMKVLGN